MNKHPAIVIVGAGMAGLGAALALHTSQYSDFILLEAQADPGGRIRTLHVNKGIIDLGAQWVHGVDTDLYRILQKDNLIHEQTSDEGLGLYIRDDGHVIDSELVKTVDFEVGRILMECEKFLDVVTESSVGEFLMNKFHDFLQTTHKTDDEKEIMQELFDWHVRFQTIDNSCRDLKQLSMKEWGRYSCLGKDGQQHINIKGGYGALVDALIRQLPANAIQYNKIVQKLEIVDHSLSDGVLVTCQDGTSMHAQAAILTCSLGVLKAFDELPLSNAARSMIHNMGFDGMGKVFLEFEWKWWPAKTEGIQLIWRRGGNAAGEFPSWLRHVSGFELVLDQPNMLLVWVAHEGVREMEETQGDVIGNQCVQLLRHFLRDDSVPYPINVYKSTWLTNPFILGGYSHSTPSCDYAALPPGKVLAEPYLDKSGVARIFLAGEAVHESKFSTTHGAFESGQMQARKLLCLI